MSLATHLKAKGLTFRTRHIYENSQLLVDGKPVDAELECVEGAANCIAERGEHLSSLPEQGGFFQLQLQIRGKFSSNLFSFQMSRPQKPNRETSSKQTGLFDQCEAERELGVC